jgi:hypothetical protein
MTQDAARSGAVATLARALSTKATPNNFKAAIFFLF